MCKTVAPPIELIPFSINWHFHIYQPGEKFEFSLLMHEINVLTNWTILAKNTQFLLIYILVLYIGWISWFEQETYCSTYSCSTYWTISTSYFYVGVIRTLNSKYQKFMTYLLVYNISLIILVYSDHNADWIDKYEL